MLAPSSAITKRRTVSTWRAIRYSVFAAAKEVSFCLLSRWRARPPPRPLAKFETACHRTNHDLPIWSHLLFPSFSDEHFFFFFLRYIWEIFKNVVFSKYTSIFILVLTTLAVLVLFNLFSIEPRLYYISFDFSKCFYWKAYILFLRLLCSSNWCTRMVTNLLFGVFFFLICYEETKEVDAMERWKQLCRFLRTEDDF